MGTRTYSRRAADGSRRATALGVRTGKFVTPTMSAQEMEEYDAYLSSEEQAFIRQFAPNPLPVRAFTDKSSPLAKRLLAVLLSQQENEYYRGYWQNYFNDPNTEFPALLDEYFSELRENTVISSELAKRMRQFQQALYEEIGYDAEPMVAKWDDMLDARADTLTVNGRPIVGWRGYANPIGKDYHSDYINGEKMWVGQGVFGNGFYVAVPPPKSSDSQYAVAVTDAVDYAQSFSSGWWTGESTENTVRTISLVGLRPNARTNIAQVEADNTKNPGSDEFLTVSARWTTKMLDAFRGMYGFDAPDIGFAAAALGYDAYVSIGNPSSSSSVAPWHLNILNRSAMVISDTAVPADDVSRNGKTSKNK